MHDSIRLNVLAFLTDLFVGLEVKPVLRSIQLPGVKKDRIIEVPDPGEKLFFYLAPKITDFSKVIH